MTTILLADDLAENRYLLMALFKGHGFDAVEAVNGAEALDKALASPPDLIVSDILMPVMDGFDLCRRWKTDERLKAIPFVFYTATYTSPQDERFCLSLGAERFLLKPQPPEALMEIVREVLEQAQHRRFGNEDRPLGDEMEVLRQHNEVLFHKLEKKVSDLRDEVARRKALEVSLAQADRLASMGMLAAGVAHEINNPLSYVLYNLESLAVELPSCAARLASTRDVLRDRLGERQLRELMGDHMVDFETEPILDVAACFRDALEGAQRIRDIVRGLGAFSRVEEESVAPVDICAPIESASVIAFHEIKYRARIHKDYKEVAPVLASESHLCQVFLNLLVNAAHAIPEGSVDKNQIVVRTWQEGSVVCAEVSDTGCGIAPSNLERVFEPFFTTKPVGVGSGLGLSIVKSLLGRYSGQIEVTSELGKGTAFRLRLPAASMATRQEAARLAAVERAEGARARILIIDDEPLVRDVLTRILREHDVVTVNGGEAALVLLGRDTSFDLVLCDIMMPKVSGIGVHKWLAENQPTLARRLVFVTGGAFTSGAKEYLEQVENPRVEKPFNAVSLQQKVAEWVARGRAAGR